MRVYIGNLNYECGEDDLVNLFEQFGPVQNVRLPINHTCQRPMGFAFADLDDQAAIEAIRQLNQTQFMGRTIYVAEARPRKETNKLEGEK